MGAQAQDGTTGAVTPPPARAPRRSFKQRLKRSLRILRVRGHDLRQDWGRAALTFTVGLIVLLAIRVPLVERSFLGAFDRQMMSMAFKLNADNVQGRADPVLFIDIDDRTLSELSPPTRATFDAPIATMPRALIADILNFVRSSPNPQTAARAMIVDIDIAAPASDGPEGVARLREALAAWAASPNAPPLIIAREAFPGSLMQQPDSVVPVMPTSPYDDIVDGSQNIWWSTVKALADKDNVVREFRPYECVRRPQGVVPLFSAAMLAYGFMEEPAVVRDAAAGHWMREARPRCEHAPEVVDSHGEMINFHMSLPRFNLQQTVWPDLPDDWSGFRYCGRNDMASMRQLAAVDLVRAAQAPDAARDVLCRRLVILGGTNGVGNDFVQTPLDDMNGSMVIANAVTGLQMTHGGLRQAPLYVQIALLLVVCLGISGSFVLSERARKRYARLKKLGLKRPWWRKAALLTLNPVILNTALAFGSHWLGVGLLLVSLSLGYWGYLSAPAFAAAITETILDFADA